MLYSLATCIGFKVGTVTGEPRAQSTKVSRIFACNDESRVQCSHVCHAEDQSIGAAKDLALLERRAQAEGFQVEEKG